MTPDFRTRLVKEGGYLAEVEVELLYDVDPWSPHLSLEDQLKIDRVRAALKQGDLDLAAQDARLRRDSQVRASRPAVRTSPMRPSQSRLLHDVRLPTLPAPG